MKKEFRLLQKIAADQCANHFNSNNGIADCCVVMGTQCVYFSDTETLPRCRYMEQAILPMGTNKVASVMYLAIVQAKAAGDTLTAAKVKNILVREGNQDTIRCEKCGERFVPSSNRAKYCGRCKKTIRKEQTRARVQTLRKGGKCNALEGQKPLSRKGSKMQKQGS